MNVDLDHLVVLQAQDLEMARLRKDLDAIPGKLAAARANVRRAAAQAAQCAALLLQEESLQREHDREIRSTRARVEKLSGSLDAATSAAQVAAFQNQLDFAASALANLEEAAFCSLERSEAVSLEQVEAADQVAAAEAQMASLHANTARLQEQHGQTIAALEREKIVLRGKISAPALALYDRLLVIKGTAIAEAIGNSHGGKCAACQMAIRPQRWNDLTGRDHDEELFTCETCGRLLFWDPRRDTPKTWMAGERLAAAHSARGGLS